MSELWLFVAFVHQQRLHHLAQRHRLQYPTAQGAQYPTAHYQTPQYGPQYGTAAPHHAGAALGAGVAMPASTGGLPAGAGAAAGGLGWQPAEARPSDKEGKAGGHLRAVETERASAHRVLRATEQPGFSWNVKEEMVRAQADAERAQRKQQRLNEAADAREQAVQEAGVLERGVAEQHPVQGDG